MVKNVQCLKTSYYLVFWADDSTLFNVFTCKTKGIITPTSWVSRKIKSMQGTEKVTRYTETTQQLFVLTYSLCLCQHPGYGKLYSSINYLLFHKW